MLSRFVTSNREKLIALIGFGVLAVALFVIVAVAQGLGHPSVPEGDIAVVEDAPDGTISKEDFDRALEQTAVRQGVRDVPAPDDPQYQAIADSAESDLLLARWVAGEAEERGIEVSDRQIDQQLEQVKQQQFGSEKAFQRFLDQSGFTPEEARERIELQLISDQIQRDVLPEQPAVSDDEVKAAYEANQAQFEQPETRDVRVVLTKTEAEANQALSDLGDSPSAKDWATVAKRYSIDDATKSSGGLRQGVVEGQSEPAFDEQVFSAEEGQLVGPFKTDAGYYAIEVEKIGQASTTSLDDASDQIRQSLVAQRQQEIAQAFQEEFQTKWVARTFCGDGYRIDRCANAEPPADPCTEKAADKQGCDAPVASRAVMQPGSAAVFGSQPSTPLPQGPVTPQSQQPATQGLPPGSVPGAVPPGSVPPGSVPPGSVPPGSVPPGSVPPGAAPQAPPPGG
jgi:parvulin-like peptidyl-prolyl isomerase